MTKNKYSVKSGINRVVDGPWKPTIEAAFQAFVDMLKEKGIQSVVNPFMAERCEPNVAPAKDINGNYYKSANVPDPNDRLCFSVSVNVVNV
jgi:hypothetical protein